MTETEILQAKAERIDRMVSSEGWKDIKEWIDGRINSLVTKVASTEGDTKVEKVEVKEDNSVHVTMVNIVKDADRHELRFWKMFYKKIYDWQEIALEQRGK